MSTKEYKRRVIALFKSGQATEQQWTDMAECVLDASEVYGIDSIDNTVRLPEVPV